MIKLVLDIMKLESSARRSRDNEELMKNGTRRNEVEKFTKTSLGPAL